jgi:hypothetical protein
MDIIGGQKIWSYFDDAQKKIQSTSNYQVRHGQGYFVRTYFELAKKVAELQFLNREFVLLFRGQDKDYRTIKSNTTLKPMLFRLSGKKIPQQKDLERRFVTLRRAEQELVRRYDEANLLGADRLTRHRVLRWSILQHYEICKTPLLDVTHSLRVAASFASINQPSEAFVFVLGVPNLSGAVTASSEAGLQVIRLSSACPPEAARPHLQEGYLLGEYPEIADFEQKAHYDYYEMDFARRLIAKFRFNPAAFWTDNFESLPVGALYPNERDTLFTLTSSLKADLKAAEQ